MILASLALAHHGTTPSQVAPQVTPARLDVVQGWTVTYGADWRSTGHHTVLRDGKTTRNAQGFRITTHALTQHVRVGFPTGTGVSLALPVGGTLTHTNAGREQHLGPGDLVLRVDQRLGPVVLNLGGTAPTGTTATHSVQMSDVVSRGTALAMQSYDTRASLGAGTWTTLGGAALDGRFQAVTGSLSTWGQLPLGENRDGVRWGATVGAQGSAGLDKGPLAARADLTLRHHTADRWIDDELGPTSGGRRTQLAVGGSLAVRPSQTVRCRASARVPVLRQAQGTQLVESFSANVGCTHRVDLRE